MRRIDLQLFAQKLNTKTSVVDYLKSIGEDSSMEARRELADSLGIGGGNYSGSYDENVALLKALQGGTQKQETPKASSAPTTASAPTNNNVAGSAISGVDQAILDKLNSSFTASSNVTNAQAEANRLLSESDLLRAVQREAEKIKEQVISECDEIKRKSYEDAEALRNQAIDEALRTKDGASVYAEQVLVSLEQNLNQLQEIVKNGQLQLERRRAESDAQLAGNYQDFRM